MILWLSVLRSLMMGSTIGLGDELWFMVAGLATCGCRPPPHMHDAYFILFVTGRSFVSLGVAKCLAVPLGQVVGVVVAARGFFSFLFSYFRAMGVFFSFLFCFFWAAREYSNFLFCYFQFAGGGLCVLFRARGLASPGPHVGARPSVRVSRVFLVVPRLEPHVSCGCLLFSLCPLDGLSHEVCTTLYAVFVGTVSSDIACLVSVAVSLLWWLVLRLYVLVSRLGFLSVALVVSPVFWCSSRFTSLVARVVSSLGYELTVLLLRSSVALRLPHDFICTGSVFQFAVLWFLRQCRLWFACHQVVMRFSG